jgi:hypothetical protein
MIVVYSALFHGRDQTRQVQAGVIESGGDHGEMGKIDGAASSVRRSFRLSHRRSSPDNTDRR